MKFNNLYEMYMLEVNDKYITLYRGLSKKIDPKHDLSSTDAPSGYSTWTDNPKLARKYAGNEGYVYKINLPKAEMKDTYIDDDGERALFYNNEKPAGLDGVSGNEYLIYHDHELFDPSDIKLHADLNEKDMATNSRNSIKYPKLGETCSGLTVLDDIPNRSSISASLTDYEIVGLYEIPLSEFDYSFKSNFYSVSDKKRVEELANEIDKNKKIKPLIVVIDNEGPYVLEGGHRLVALGKLGIKTLPALVVLDKDEIMENAYKGEHESPDKDNGKPMHNLDGIYPDDIYTSKGAKYYGDRGGDSIDNESINIIKNVKNKPNAKVKIYRAVPDINNNVNDKITSLESLIYYFNKHNFFPMNNKLVNNYSKKYYDEETGYTIPYNDAQKKILDDIKKDIESLKSELQDKIGINFGDWVTISKQYAIEHGKDNLNNNYKIISKTVPASTLYTDGNSIHEWGYNE